MRTAKGDVHYTYDEQEFSDLLASYGLTPSPLPELPLKIGLPDGRTLEARENRLGSDGDVNPEGIRRIVTLVR